MWKDVVSAEFRSFHPKFYGKRVIKKNNKQKKQTSKISKDKSPTKGVTPYLGLNPKATFSHKDVFYKQNINKKPKMNTFIKQFENLKIAFERNKFN